MGQSKRINELATERRMQEAERYINEEKELTNKPIKNMKTVNIKGKEYVEVNERIKHFRDKYQGWGLVTNIIELTANRVVMKAEVIDESGVARSSGTAFEDQDSGFINKTSFIENCETSAIGRALGNFGIGIDTSVASYEEVRNAIAQVEEEMTPDQRGGIINLLTTAVIDQKMAKSITDKVDTFNYKDAEKTLKYLKAKQK